LAREQRKLAAIVAADVVGYSRLMGRDESGTLARLRQNRSERLDPVLAKYGGRLVKLTGDGALVEFGSAVDALSAAIEFQQAMAEANVEEPAGSALVFRMGLHLGDLIVDGDDLYGDGVNVAARLEGVAPAGGVVISRTVHEAVMGRVKASFDDLGNLTLKNIERPVQAFNVKWEPSDWQQIVSAEVTATSAAAPQVPLPLPDKPSIAVLPFQNMSGDPEQEYFADGIVEDIIIALSRFKSLFVIARNSSFAYKGKSPDVRQVGRELGVRYLLEGSVRKAGNRVRITGQLIQAETGAHIWAERYEGNFTEIFDLQDRVTTDVVGAITPKLVQAEIERAKRKRPDSLAAYDCYLRAVAGFNGGTLDSLRDAQRFCSQAIKLAPEYPTPLAMAAWLHAVLISRGVPLDGAAMSEATTLARRAVDLDQDDAVILCMASWAHAMIARDLDLSAGLVERALVLNQNSAMAWQVSGWVNMWLGRSEIGIDHFARAARLSPLDPTMPRIQTGAAHAHFMVGRYNDALSLAKKALEHWQASPAYRIAAASAGLAGRVAEANRFVELLLDFDPKRRVSNLNEVMGPYRRPQDLERYREGLRKAGLPE
jgi:adenylate cyclase